MCDAVATVALRVSTLLTGTNDDDADEDAVFCVGTVLGDRQTVR